MTPTAIAAVRQIGDAIQFDTDIPINIGITANIAALGTEIFLPQCLQLADSAGPRQVFRQNPMAV
jgi:hypothetical protein